MALQCQGLFPRQCETLVLNCRVLLLTNLPALPIQQRGKTLFLLTLTSRIFHLQQNRHRLLPIYMPKNPHHLNDQSLQFLANPAMQAPYYL